MNSPHVRPKEAVRSPPGGRIVCCRAAATAPCMAVHKHEITHQMAIFWSLRRPMTGVFSILHVLFGICNMHYERLCMETVPEA